MKSSFGISKDTTANSTPSTIVYFDQLTPTTGGVVFTPNTPATEDVLYISTVDGSTWTYYSGAYHTYTPPTTSSTEFNISGTSIDAGGNKTIAIERSGAMFLNGASNSDWQLNVVNTGTTNAHGMVVGVGASSTGVPYRVVKGVTTLFNVANDGTVSTKNWVLPLSAPSAGQTLGYVSAGVSGWITYGLSYFTESQSTSAPNDTVNADQLLAVASTSDADFVIKPKGVGAIQSIIADSTAVGGNKRGASSVDFQQVRTDATHVASGVGSVLIGGSGNIASGQEAVVVGGTGNIASGLRSFAGGRLGSATNQYSFFFGNGGSATKAYAFAFGASTNATGDQSFAFNGNASGDYSTVFGGANTNTASGTASFVAGGLYNIASGRSSFVWGETNLVNSAYAGVGGQTGSTKGIVSRFTLGNFDNIAPYVQGASQMSLGVVSTKTTDATATSLLAYGGSLIALPLQNNEAIRFKGSIMGKQSGSTNVSVWDIDGVIVRNATVGSTILSISNVTIVVDTIGTGTPTLTADTTNGGLDVKVIGLVATTIRWVCNITSTESILA